MALRHPIKLNTDPDVVTFESARPIDTDKQDIPKIRVGYNGKLVAILYQYLNPNPSKEGITNGQWFALPVVQAVSADVLAIKPAGQSLDDLKEVMTNLLKNQTGPL